jgi:hypothetical protein
MGIFGGGVVAPEKQEARTFVRASPHRVGAYPRWERKQSEQYTGLAPLGLNGTRAS